MENIMPKHYVMIIDLGACIGCDTCTVACKQENNLPAGVSWSQLITIDSINTGEDSQNLIGSYPNLKQDFLPLSCQHCANGPCVEVCPTSATYRSPEDGIVMQDPSLCIGCRYCMVVCPFTSVRIYSDSHPTFTLPFPTGGNPIGHRANTVEKCTFCSHRILRGQLPACVEACPTGARTFGDLNDPESEVSELLRKNPHFRLLVDKATEPSIYYLP
jgi:molybdopterin-containing oxidoreductase family iron-sulfur binding subunit